MLLDLHGERLQLVSDAGKLEIIIWIEKCKCIPESNAS
jgi:hypothetical protein